MKLHALPFAALLALSGCAAPESPVQRISLQSGDFGVAELATVRAVDPIVLRDNIVRFDIAFGEFAVSILSESAPVAAAIWTETARALGAAFAAELEDYIRGLSCVYTVKPQGRFITGAVAETVRFGGSDDEAGLVLEGAGVPFEDDGPSVGSSASRAWSSVVITDAGRTLPPNKTDNLDISVVSNCLIGVHPGSTVRVVQTPDRMMILPQPVRAQRRGR